jgi:hypothetical protein
MKRYRIAGILVALLALGTFCPNASAEEGFLPLAVHGVQFLGKNVVLENTAGERINCAKLTGTGLFQFDSTGNGTLDLAECEFFGFAAFSLGEKETTIIKEALILAKIEFIVCLIDSAKLLFGIFVRLTEPVHVHVKALASLITFEGAVIGHILTTKGTLVVIDFKAEKGKQAIIECKEEGGLVLFHTLTSKTNAEKKLAQSMSLSQALLQFGETVEVMDK